MKPCPWPTPPRACAASSTALDGRRASPTPTTPGPSHQGQGDDRQARPGGRSRRLHRHGSAQQPWNFNAPAAVTRAAVLYVVRTLVDADIPMNEGCMQPIDLILPQGSIVACDHPAAVCAGNVETSQWVTDALYGALGVLAAAQGTMNNFTFGNDEHQYYETICGGSGAGPDFDGTSAVHTHMTNTRLTDPEVLEWRLSVAALEPSHRPRLGRGRAPQGRRRHDPKDPLPRADDGRDLEQPPRGAALRAGRRCARPLRRRVGRARGRPPGAARRPRQDGARGGRCLRDPDAERGWLWGRSDRDVLSCSD